MRTLKLIATSGCLIGLAIGFAREAPAVFIGAFSLGLVMGAAALSPRRSA